MKTVQRLTAVSVTLLAAVLPFTIAAAADGPPPARVRTAPVVQEEIARSRPAMGIVSFDRVSDISTELAGLVEKVEIRQGDTVRQGQVLVHLNTEILEKEIAYKQARLEQIELQIANARKNFSRLERLFKSSGVSEKEFDDALYAFEDAQKEKQAVAATLDKLLIQKKRSQIPAPFDGIVLSKDVDAGSWVQPGRQLASIASLSDLVVRVPIAETTLQFIEIGQQVPVTITAFNRKLEGTIFELDPVADLKTKNIFLKVAIPPQPLVAQNMSATVEVPVSPRQQLSVFSRAALVTFQGGDFVYTIKDGKAAILPVNVVAYLGDRVGTDTPQIVPGLELVVEGNERLRPDQPVAVAGEN